MQKGYTPAARSAGAGGALIFLKFREKDAIT